MYIASRAVGTALLAITLLLGWQVLLFSSVGYVWLAVPALLAAWAAAWFGEEVSSLLQIGHDGIVRAVGLLFFAVMGFVVAAARWQWF